MSSPEPIKDILVEKQSSIKRAYNHNLYRKSVFGGFITALLMIAAYFFALLFIL